MIRYRSPKERRSRMAEVENRRLVKQTILMLLVGLAIIGAIVFLGIPALIKLAVFLGEMKNSATPIAQEDTIPPPTPQLLTLPVATSSASLSLEGFTEKNATIKLFHNGQLSTETLANNDGLFVFQDINLEDGLNRFYTIALDASGNESPPSSIQNTIYDSEAPTLTISKPLSGQQFYGQNERLITVMGTTDPGVQVKLNDTLLVTNQDGNFSTTYQLNEGSNELKFSAQDSAFNTSESSLSVEYHP